MTHNKYTIKDGEIIVTTTIKIDDYSKLLRFNKNLYCLAYDIRHSRSDEHFKNFLLKAEELFTEEVKHAKPRENSPLGKHSIFYYMYGHMNDWVRYAEREVICAKAMFTQAYRIEETIQIIRNSRDKEDAAKKLMDVIVVGTGAWVRGCYNSNTSKAILLVANWQPVSERVMLSAPINVALSR